VQSELSFLPFFSIVLPSLLSQQQAMPLMPSCTLPETNIKLSQEGRSMQTSVTVVETFESGTLMPPPITDLPSPSPSPRSDTALFVLISFETRVRQRRPRAAYPRARHVAPASGAVACCSRSSRGSWPLTRCFGPCSSDGITKTGDARLRVPAAARVGSLLPAASLAMLIMPLRCFSTTFPTAGLVGFLIAGRGQRKDWSSVCSNGWCLY
jgi:hypothetical protein